MKKLLILTLLLVVMLGVLSAAAFYHLSVHGFAVDLSQDDIQARIEAHFPVEKSYRGLVNLTLSEPRIDLNAHDERIEYQVRALIEVEGLDRRLEGRARISGVPRFNPETQQIHFAEAKVEELDVAQIPALLRKPANDTASLIVREQLNRRPLLDLNDADLPNFARLLVLKDLQIVDGKLRLVLGI